MINFKKAKLKQKYIIIHCICEERIQLMGLRSGEKIELLCECLFGGTVMVRSRLGNFCVRRNEINAILKEVE